MNFTTRGLVAIGAIVLSLSAHAQLTSEDGGTVAVDSSGLMWANTVGTGLTWSSTGAAGSAQAWVAALNVSDYGGYSNWTLATGNASTGPNTTTDQLGDLFYSDCGNTSGEASSFSNAGKNCTALSSVDTAITGKSGGAIFFSGSLYGTTCCNPMSTYWWMYESSSSGQGAWNYDSSYFGKLSGDAIAVREAPEIDPASAASGFALLFGCLLVIGAKRARI